MHWTPLAVPYPDRKPEGGARRIVNEDSPYAPGLALDWVAGAGAWVTPFDDVRISSTSRPGKVHSKPGLVASFASGVEDEYRLDGESLHLDTNKPFTLAFEVLRHTATYNQAFQFAKIDGSPAQFIFSDDVNYADFWVGDGSTWGGVKFPGVAPVDKWMRGVLRFNGSGDFAGASAFDMFVSGNRIAGQSGGASLILPNTNIIGRTDGAGRLFYGYQANIKLWPGRYLNIDFAKELSQRLYAPFGEAITYEASDPIRYLTPDPSTGEDVFFAGAVGASSDLAGRLEVERALAGVDGGTADLAAALNALRDLAADIGASAGLVVALEVERALAGAIGAIGGLTSRAEVERELAGAIGAIADLVGALEVGGVGEIEFAGLIGGASDMTGRLEVEREFSGTLVARADLVAALALGRDFAGSIPALVATAGHIHVLRELAGDIVAVSGLTGALSKTVRKALYTNVVGAKDNTNVVAAADTTNKVQR